MQGFLDESVFCFLILFCLFIYFLFAFYAKIQDGWENDFWEKSPVDSADTLLVKNFLEITISLRFQDDCVFCVLCRNTKWTQKVVGKRFMGKVASRLSRYPVGKNFCQNRSISLCFRDKHVFALNAEIQDGRQKWRENIVLKKSRQ